MLGVEKVGIYDNFFELGGDSIISIRLISKINETFNQRIQLRDLFRYSNIERFSALVLNSDQYDNKIEQLYKTVESEIISLRLSVMNSIANSDLVEDIYPMTDVQQGMIMESLVDPSLGVFHDQMLFPFQDGSFDLAKFNKAISLLIEKHSIFRTSFNFSDYDQPIQIVSKRVYFDIKQIDLSLFDKENQERKIEEFLISERAIPFDIQEGSLYRFSIFNIDNSHKVFVYQFHHSIMDGWSVASFITELYKTYFELKKGNDSFFTTSLACSQRDFIIKELIAKQDVDAISFWKEELSGYKYLDIFSEETEITEYYTKQYDLSFLNALKKQCKDHNLTLKSVLFGAYIYALQMFTYEKELTVGLVANNRPSIKDGDKVLGCFLNTLPVRYVFESEKSWLSYFESIEKKMNEINLYGHLTFFEIKRLIGIDRDDSFFDVLFNYIDFHVYNDIILEDTSTNIPVSNDDVESNKGLKTTSFERTSSSLNLTVNLTGGMGVEFQYALHKNFKSELSLERFHTYLDSILNCFTDKLDSHVSVGLILQEKEFHQLLYSFNDTTVAYPKDKTLVDLFEEQVKKTPAAIAVVYEGAELSYKELDEKSNQLANYLLTTISINSQCLIGVVLERSDWLIISFLAILKTGSVYVPIDLNYPEERKEYIKKDSGCSIIIDDLYLSLFKDTISDYAVALPRIVIKSDDLAYVIYTSGSTGQPKGVMIEHKNLIHLCLWHKRMYAVTAKSRSSLFSGIGFDASIWEICPYLVSGASLYPISDKIRYDLDQFSKFVLENSISHSYIPTSLCESIIEQEISLPNLVVLTGGDVLRLNKQVNIDIYNNYGPTESTVVATTYKVASTPLTKIPIGKPIDNTMVYIMDEAHHLLPIGVIGELCIGGAGVARGYLNKEELTREKFISNPFIEGDRIYKTGDLARWLPDGNLEFIGRKDDQVKIRGYRIELGEIENVLSSIAGIIHCCVLAKEDSNDTKRLIGYVVAEGKLDRAALQEQLKLSLPEYMVPMIWVELAELPLTSNGKLDRKALPDPDSSDLSTKEYIAPRTETEGKLAQIWQNLLGVEKVGVYDNFFELGGHSLLVVKLVATINKLLNTNINIIDIFKYPTIYNFVENMNSLLSYKNDIMIPLQEAGNKKEIFLAPPGSGTINSYIQLVKLLGEDQPVYAFQSPGLDGKSPISKSIEEMASTFIIEMQKLNPSGPYRLGGYSFGGIVAYEMASQLLNDGFDVEELLIFDSSPLEFSFPKDENIDQEEVYRDLLKKLVHAILGKDFTSSDLVLEDKTKEEQITQVSKLLNNSKFKISEEDIRGHLEVNICNKNYNYLPREEKLDISIVLFRAMYVLSEGENEKEINLVQNDNEEFDYGWQRYTTKEVIVHNIPSTHLNMLDNIHSKQVCDILIDLNKLVL
ncbi:amino acid adenylation domain-containing protein [Flavobacterium collinsii]|uniref:Tyrocidine synthase 3 n=1 Tax=Flavobacterium collinsii TaxID=1114861 RepID=A0ABM8KQ91_9FLAO|nr:Tyrocidine synthase 3 [Flavobacterium collinsii]